MSSSVQRKAIVLPPGAGRSYPMGRLSAVFKADEQETAHSYSISEWWMEPNTKGPGAHVHDEDDIFYVLEGTFHFFVGDHWTEAGRGSFVLVPGGVPHDFENRGSEPAGFLNFSAPGDFEPAMPDIAQWFRDRSPEDTNVK